MRVAVTSSRRSSRATGAPVVSACALVLVVFVALAALPARAQVAVAVSIAEEDASQRDLAGKVVSVARKSWLMLYPQLTSAQTKTCTAGDTECLRNVAARAKATHLLVVGVAPLGVRDRVVAVQLFDVTKEAPRFEESVVQSGLSEDLGDVKALSARLAAAEGPPPYQPPPPFVPPEPAPVSDFGSLSVGGFVLVGAGGVTALGSLITGWTLVEFNQQNLGSQIMLAGAATGGALAAVGTIAFTVDAL